jgi:hypothetical protein
VDATHLAESLSPVLAELATGAVYSELLALDLSSAPCRGHAKRLILGQCDSDSIEWSGLIRQCWVADADGFRTDPEGLFWPRTKQLNDEGFVAEHPMILFATDGQAVRLCCIFGQQWRGFRLGRVSASGTLVPGSVVPDGPDPAT